MGPPPGAKVAVQHGSKRIEHDTYRSLEGGILYGYTEGEGTSGRRLRPVPGNGIEFLQGHLARDPRLGYHYTHYEAIGELRHGCQGLSFI